MSGLPPPPPFPAALRGRVVTPPPIADTNPVEFHRWNADEEKQLAQLKEKLGNLLFDRPQFPDVVGDRKLIRFLRGHDHNVDKACEMVTNFFKWRDEHGVDEVRERILRGGLNHPTRFPLGAKIVSLIPQIVIAHDACDKFGAPICVDQYNFSPAAVLAVLDIPEYITFIIHR